MNFHEMETFVPIEGFPNYEVSSFGRIKSLRSGRYITLRVRSDGYVDTRLTKAYKQRPNVYVSRLVAQHFISNSLNKQEVDHIDKNKLNNHVSNLRWTTKSENQMNTSTRRSSTSNFKGVTYKKDKRKWVARITKNHGREHIGYFDTKDEAAAAYNTAAREMFREFAHLNII